jgi:hypothetical protein
LYEKQYQLFTGFIRGKDTVFSKALSKYDDHKKGNG